MTLLPVSVLSRKNNKSTFLPSSEEQTISVTSQVFFLYLSSKHPTSGYRQIYLPFTLLRLTTASGETQQKLHKNITHSFSIEHHCPSVSAFPASNSQTHSPLCSSPAMPAPRPWQAPFPTKWKGKILQLLSRKVTLLYIRLKIWKLHCT